MCGPDFGLLRAIPVDGFGKWECQQRDVGVGVDGAGHGKWDCVAWTFDSFSYALSLGWGSGTAGSWAWDFGLMSRSPSLGLQMDLG